jgi:hypothetical protein
MDGVDTANKSVWHTRRQVKEVMDQGQEEISEVVEAAREAIIKSKPSVLLFCKSLWWQRVSHCFELL